MTIIHPTAIIEPGAKIGHDVFIGPYCCIGEHVQLEDKVHLVSHVSLAGHLTVGEGTKVYPFASLGHPPQDLKYHGEPSKTTIGKNTTIREYVTVQPGTEAGLMHTQVGNNCLLMVGSHVAHDCVVGDHVIMANNATLGGHVTVGNFVIIGGLSAVQQFVRIGDHAIIGGMSGVEKDVIPYGMVMGERAFLNGLNLVGLKRRGFSTETVQALMKLYDQLFDIHSTSPLAQRVVQAKQAFSGHETVESVLHFLESQSKRSFCLPKAYHV
jgi:UDP-N-acetylglucosamine acyltransferase